MDGGTRRNTLTGTAERVWRTEIGVATAEATGDSEPNWAEDIKGLAHGPHNLKEIGLQQLKVSVLNWNEVELQWSKLYFTLKYKNWGFVYLLWISLF